MDVGLLIDIGDTDNTESNQPKTNKKERRSYYGLPKTLSEEDDTFGVLSKAGTSKISHTSQLESSVNTGVLVQIESSQSGSSASDSTQVSGFSSRLQSTQDMISRGYSFTSSIASGPSISSISDSRYFENISRISNAENPSGLSLLSNDEVFSAEKQDLDKPPDWEMIMNEARLLALTIDMDKPLKTPHQIADSDGLFGTFSPCEGLDSPLFDINKETPPEDMLLPLTPTKSPVKNLTNDITALENTESHVSEMSSKSTIGSVSQSECDEGITEIDGVVPLILQETPKKPGGRRSAGFNQKENINPTKPRQLVPKVNTSMKKDKLKPANGIQRLKPKAPGENANKMLPAGETVEKVKNKIQKSNVMRTSMTNPGIDLNKLDTEKNAEPSTVTSKGRTPGTTFKRSTPIKPLQTKYSLSTNKPATSVIKPTGTKPSYQNVKSKIQTGKPMPALKGTLGKTEKPGIKAVGPPSTTKSMNSSLKPVVPSASMSASKRPSALSASMSACKKPVVPPASMSASKKPVLSAAASAPRPQLQRQGSGLARPTPIAVKSKLATPARARQSLTFGTPGLSQLPTPNSRLAVASKLTTPRSALATPKAKSSLRFSTLPSPQVNKGNASLISSTPAVPYPKMMPNNSNASLVSSTPAIPNPRVVSSGLPSPIGVKRRTAN